MVPEVKAILLVVIMLTTPDGHSIWVESKHISTIKEPDHHCPPRSSAIVRLDSGGSICVMEKPSEISDKVRGQ
jgi:uncharacterized protein YlzI (FlbEa/FlbD family)